MSTSGKPTFTFNDLHKDGWGRAPSQEYQNKNFSLGDFNLGKLKESSYSGSTPELIFGDDDNYLYKVVAPRLKILDLRGNGFGVPIADRQSEKDGFTEITGGGKKFRKTRRKINKKRKSNKRR